MVGISEGFNFNIETLRTVKGHRDILCHSRKHGAPGPQHTKGKVTGKAACSDVRVKGVKLLSLHTPSLNYTLTLKPHLEDQGVQGSMNTLEEVAASGWVCRWEGGGRKGQRKRHLFVILLMINMWLGFFFFPSLLHFHQFSAFVIVRIYWCLVASL